jgi:hypothetical protein
MTQTISTHTAQPDAAALDGLAFDLAFFASLAISAREAAARHETALALAHWTRLRLVGRDISHHFDALAERIEEPRA